MTETTVKQWKHPGGVRGLIDGGTGVVVLLWLGILLLVPSRPSADPAVPPAPSCMITTCDEALDQLPLARCPDLVTLPSPVSFGAGGPAVDSLQAVPPLRRYTGKPLSPMEAVIPLDDDATPLAALRRAAAESLLPHPVLPVVPEVGAGTIPVSKTGWYVLGSPALADTQLSAGLDEVLRLPADIKQFEAELWVQFDKDGRPLEIFIEKSVNRDVALQLVRQLWNPARWTGAKGHGLIPARYLAGTGGNDANTNN